MLASATLGACKAPAKSITAGAHVFCVERKDSSYYCFGGAVEDPSAVPLPERYDGARLFLGATICAETPNDAWCAPSSWRRPDEVERQPFAHSLQEWVQLRPESTWRNSQGRYPPRACGRSADGTMVCGDLVGTAEPTSLIRIDTEALANLVLHGAEVCGLTEGAEIRCFHPAGGTVQAFGRVGARRLFGGSGWLCAEYMPHDVECYPYVGSKVRNVWRPDVEKELAAIVPGDRLEICLHATDGSLSCFALSRDGMGVPTAERLQRRPTAVTQVVAGSSMFCALVRDEVVCWQSGATEDWKAEQLPKGAPTP